MKMKTRTPQSGLCFQTPLGPFSAKFKVTANELGQGRIQLRCYEDILLNGNCRKILNLKMKCISILKQQQIYKILNLLETREKQ